MIRVEVTGYDFYKRALSQSPIATADAFDDTVREIRPIITEIVGNVFKEAASTAGEGFPSVYLSSLLEVLSGLQFDTITLSGAFEIFFDFERLGTYDDLIEGAHYKAALADGEISDIPYRGEELKNPILKRYLAWLRLSPEARDDTYDARAAYWLSQGKAPQWLLLNYGQTLYEPYITPYPIVELASQQIEVLAASILERNIQENLKKVWGSNFQSRGSTRASTGRVYTRDSRGRFTSPQNTGD